MTANSDLFESLSVLDDCHRVATVIDGLGFASNYLLEHQSPEIHPETKILSNPGSIVGHFVTHGAGFRYSTFGVHVGQVDRLTFHSATPKRVTGYFIDCRQDSPSRGRRLSIEFGTNAWRKLIIPCGVAHTFENLEGVVTRNDLTLVADASNPSWNLLNDDVVFPWTAEGIKTAPEVTINTTEIPLSAATMFYGLQRQLLRGGRKQSSLEVQATIAGKETRLIVSSDLDRSADVRLPLFEEGPIGCEFALNSFNSVADASWAVVPTTASCVADWVIVDMDTDEQVWFSYHTRQTVLHTFLDGEGSSVLLEVVDLRSTSRSFRRRTACRFTCDPRFHVRIPPGVAYRYIGQGRYGLRVEYEMFVDTNEPRLDLPPIGADRINLPTERLDGATGVTPPNLALPASVQQMMARREYEMIEQSWEAQLNAARSRYRSAFSR
ncbi:hypothetical protein [Paludibacterium paludis]|uniref:dTDP-4-dehydrorhamnose 3,5-epimerase n=1 Tax=Paludibacterium paludis TaxID=1225769 RepID=A0A918UBC2_9NEIS|nr:hypothetical protein [Paludibacterium paludis]GGY22530.1 hypothetical protein GCM10011289_27950 [Paludibacterium paludis]